VFDKFTTFPISLPPYKESNVNLGLPNVLPGREIWDTFKRVAPLPWLFSNKPAALFDGIPVHSLVIAISVVYFFPAGIAPEKTFLPAPQWLQMIMDMR
jgi:hypothetical protein